MVILGRTFTSLKEIHEVIQWHVFSNEQYFPTVHGVLQQLMDGDGVIGVQLNQSLHQQKCHNVGSTAFVHRDTRMASI